MVTGRSWSCKSAMLHGSGWCYGFHPIRIRGIHCRHVTLQQLKFEGLVVQVSMKETLASGNGACHTSAVCAWHSSRHPKVMSLRRATQVRVDIESDAQTLFRMTQIELSQHQ